MNKAEKKKMVLYEMTQVVKAFEKVGPLNEEIDEWCEEDEIFAKQFHRLGEKLDEVIPNK